MACLAGMNKMRWRSGRCHCSRYFARYMTAFSHTCDYQPSFKRCNEFDRAHENTIKCIGNSLKTFDFLLQTKSPGFDIR